MDAQIVVALMSPIISAVAGLLGALIGYRGSQRTTQRNIDLAREQRRFERAQEMRAEVIPKLFVLLEHVEESIAWMLDLPSRGTEWMRPIMRDYLEGRLNEEQAAAREEEALALLHREYDAFERQMKELKDYFLLHRIWLPEHLVSEFEAVMDGYDAHLPNVVRVMTQWAARGQSFFETDAEDVKAVDEFLNQEKDFYDAGVREMRDWFEGDRLRREAAMWSAAREVLAVEE
jgi:hypothetical protein